MGLQAVNCLLPGLESLQALPQLVQPASEDARYWKINVPMSTKSPEKVIFMMPVTITKSITEEPFQQT